jgi:integrase
MRRLTAAAVERFKPGTKRIEIGDGGSESLRLVIHPSGKKSWAMRFRGPKGKHAKITLGPVNLLDGRASVSPRLGAPLTLGEARELAADVNRKRAAGVDVVAEHRRQADNSGSDAFPAVAQEFVRDYQRRGRRTWREVARNLGLSYDASGANPNEIAGGLADRWRSRSIGEITAQDVHAVIQESITQGLPGLGRKGEGRSENRGRHLSEALGPLFRWVARHRRGSSPSNPMRDVHRGSPPPPRQRVLNARLEVRRADELRWFWAATEELPVPFGALFLLLLLTGCRLSEIARMRRDELADDGRKLYVSGERTKNGRPHVIALSELAMQVLNTVPRIEGCRYVFSTNGKTPVSGFSKMKARLDSAMRQAADAEGAALQPWRLHDLRRTAATGMAGIGVAPHVVEAALNHVSGAKAGVAGTYNVEAYAEERRQALERWGRHVAQAVV